MSKTARTKNGSQSAHNSMEKKSSLKDANRKSYFQETYKEMNSLREIPVNDAYLLKFALEWVDFTRNEENEVLTLDEFYIYKAIDPKTVYRWMDRCSELKQAHDFVKMIVGSRREKGAIKRKYAEGIIVRSMAMYDNRWKDLEEWRSNLQKKVDEVNNQQKIITIPVYYKEGDK